MMPHTAKSSSSSLQQQGPRPRHPYAFIQCEGDDCVECLREEIAFLRGQNKDLETAEATVRGQWRAVLSFLERERRKNQELSKALLIEQARHFMALDEQGQMDLVRANPDLCDAFERGIESGEIPAHLFNGDEMMNKMGFFEWVAKTRRVTDDPRGDFVKDTKDLWDVHGDEQTMEAIFNSRACNEAREQEKKLRRLYNDEL